MGKCFMPGSFQETEHAYRGEPRNFQRGRRGSDKVRGQRWLIIPLRTRDVLVSFFLFFFFKIYLLLLNGTGLNLII